ncbi:hypothetical protein Ssi03_59520 [Sphaerisporangium siamense]|uniref:Uncharacterized protein n=1 Tax=Sphaerisporangium siamense TaxID=795645 RepID=A0A7W7D3T6_9ACTN|nr:hypothetical protein [Sphaerisporangium siamense]MBB4699782.1 hypothetical protein [Sphaerisporangium siamense]GII87962.1 hypothetical protein Ssi03_59520 [Sphaerisporangium siamense]
MRCVRRYRFDHNPLRRRSDRIEAVAVLLTLLVLVASVWPALLAGRVVYQRGLTAERVDPEVRQQVTAVLLENGAATNPVSSQGTVLGVKAKARWYMPDGSVHMGVVSVPAHAKAGSSLELWVDAHGTPTAAPRTHAQTVADAVVAGFGVVAGIGGLLFLNLALLRWMLDRRRYVEWEKEWTAVHDRWRRPRQP